MGKNESGKSAFLQALYRLKPAFSNNSRTRVEMDYPRWRLIQDQRREDINHVPLATCMFCLEPPEVQELSELVDLEVPQTTRITVTRHYDGTAAYSISIEDADAVTALLEGNEAAATGDAPTEAPHTLEDLANFAKVNKRRALQREVDKWLAVTKSDLPPEVCQWIDGRLPTFFYFDNYSMLSGRVDLAKLSNASPDQLTESEQTALSLLQMASVTPKELMQGEFELRKAQLEAASSDISRQVFRYWTQNKYLRTSFDVESDTIQEQGGQRVVHRFLNVRLADHRHGDFTTNIDTRSSGFRWFFSFLSAFAQYADRSDMIVLLDEPGLSLHGRAQSDFLRYLDTELGPHVQVIYTRAAATTQKDRRHRHLRVSSQGGISWVCA